MMSSELSSWFGTRKSGSGRQESGFCEISRSLLVPWFSVLSLNKSTVTVHVLY